ncbi:MAG: nucleotidyl transferase AbiEii/AbiGii toxin family protein [Bacteroidales bacterium]
MINPQTYSPAWIDSFKQQSKFRTVNPALFEKLIYAFSLLESLAASGFDFIFKGGTSLMLMPLSIERFSIDIDIVTSKSKDELDHVVNSLIGGTVFTAMHEDARRTNAGGIPKAHYKFDFNATANKTGSILLDVLFEENPYESLTRAEIRSPWLNTSDPYQLVNIPSIDSILGDKLTAFAPNSTGVPYWLGNPDFPDKRIEIIKQLHDISILIDHYTDISLANRVFRTIAQRQISYRNLSLQVEDVIQDIFSTALILAKRDKNLAEPDISKFSDLQSGILMFKGYLITGTFRIEDAIVASAKAACFTRAFLHHSDNPFQLFDDKTNLTEWEILNLEYNFLNRLKRTNREAFYYWFKCLEMMNLISIR